ncbi:MAG: hypothetical protein JSR61_20040 [Proteobacteria bacterium]|nr:hypothetical protein [Pseudomonadota bacterium]
MTSPSTCAPNDPTLRLMPREMRMMTERVFSLSGQPKGFFLMVQDVVMYSQKLGLGGFALLEQRWADLKKADPTRVWVAHEADDSLTLDAAGEQAWFIIPTVIDLMGELAARYGRATVTVINARDAGELRVAADLAARNGLRVTFGNGPQPTLTATPFAITGRISEDEPLLWDLLQNGVSLEADQWWRVYALALKALAPDSVVSRRHAGPVIVNDDGSIIGRKDSDDETDLSFLISPRNPESKSESVGP